MGQKRVLAFLACPECGFQCTIDELIAQQDYEVNRLVPLPEEQELPSNPALPQEALGPGRCK
jgi:hypothetical protein